MVVQKSSGMGVEARVAEDTLIVSLQAVTDVYPVLGVWGGGCCSRGTSRQDISLSRKHAKQNRGRKHLYWTSNDKKHPSLYANLLLNSYMWDRCVKQCPLFLLVLCFDTPIPVCALSLFPSPTPSPFLFLFLSSWVIRPTGRPQDTLGKLQRPVEKRTVG